jgi:hypothetical protein
MRQLKLIGLACLALFALTSAMASSASALVLPEILPLVEERKFTGENDGGEPELVASAAGTEPIKCTGATALEGTEEAKKPLGLYHIHFTGCKSNILGTLTPCNSEGDLKEVILNLGTWHLVFDQEKPELLTATLFLPELVLIECGKVKIHVEGSVLCLDLPLLTDKRHFLFHCTQNKGVADEKKYFNAGDKVGTEGKVQLLCNFGFGFKECAELALGLVLYEKAIELVDL